MRPGGTASRRSFLAWLAVAGVLSASPHGRAQEAAQETPGEERFAQAFQLLGATILVLNQKSVYGLSQDEVVRGCALKLGSRLDLPSRERAHGLRSVEGDKLLDGLESLLDEAVRSGLKQGDPLLITRATIRAYLRDLDRYSDYLSPEDLKLFRHRQQGTYVGLGFLYSVSRDGSLRCYPFPGSQAQKAGMVAGDKLVAVNDAQTEGLDLFAVGRLVTGAPGETLNLTLERESLGNLRMVVPASLESDRPSLVQGIEEGEHRVLRILFFKEDTAASCRQILEGYGKTTPLTIDLRGCSGGELDEAVSTASLFLAKGSEVCQVVDREQQVRSLRTETAPMVRPRSIRLLVDGGTASAAEVFAIALLHHLGGEVVTTEGSETYGKGVTTLLEELSLGGALLYSDSSLLGPEGTVIEGRGVPITKPAGNGE